MRCLTWQLPSWMTSISKGHLPIMRPLKMDGIHQLPSQNHNHNHIQSHVHQVQMVFFYEVTVENSGICCFICNHVDNMNRILQWFKKAGGTFSGWKMDLCIPEVVTISHKCTYRDHYPEDQKVQKILDWLGCTSLTEVCGFLGVCRVVRIWVKDFEKHARLLVILMKKDVEFMWGPEQEKAMEDLKQAIIMAPCLQPIDYHCDQTVILEVDSSCIATGFILLQLGADSKRYPSRFGSITWNDWESCYSQAKIEIYGLWCALQGYQPYIIGIRNIRVEIDASYIKGMLNHPDIQPGVAMNRWIVGIKLFHFELVHVPGTLHTGLDGLSCRAPSP